MRTEAKAVAGGEWAGQLFLVLAPTETFASLDVEEKDAIVTSYSARDLRD